jgi:hypothetical protein
LLRDDSLRLQAEGFWNDAGVSSHTTRSVHAHERAELKATHALHGTIVSTVVFLPVALRHGTRTLFSWQRAKELSRHSLWSVKKRKGLPAGSAAYIPRAKAQGLTPRFGKAERENPRHSCLILTHM